MNDELTKAQHAAIKDLALLSVKPTLATLESSIDSMDNRVRKLEHNENAQPFLKDPFSISRPKEGASIARTLRGWIGELDDQDRKLHKKVDRLISEATEERVNLRTVLSDLRQEVDQQRHFANAKAQQVQEIREALGNLALFLAGAFSGMRYHEVAEGVKEVMAQLEGKE